MNTKPLKLAIMVRMFPNIVQTYVLSHILSLRRAGHETLIIAEQDPGQNEVHPRVIESHLVDEAIYIDPDNGNLVSQIPYQVLFSARYIGAALRLLLSGILVRHGIKYTVKALIRVMVESHHKFDIIHSHSLFSSYDYLFLKEVFGIPLTTTFHGLVPKNVEMLEDRKIRAVLNTGDAFFVNTNFAKSQLEVLGCDAGKIHIIPQGINLDDFPFSSRKIESWELITILSVGRLSIEKGFHIAIKAIGRLIEAFPNVRYHIVGGGPEKENLTRLIEAEGLRDKVIIFGSISTEQLLSHYAEAHIFILPSIDFCDGSHTETQGVVLQEAQASGIPVIASRTGGIPEVVIDGDTGLLFAEEDDHELANHIQSLIFDPVLYEKLHLQGRRNVEERFSADVICAQLSSVYYQFLDRRREN